MKQLLQQVECAQRTWTHEEVWEAEPVLRCSLSLPHLPAPRRRSIRRMDRYYQALVDHLKRFWLRQTVPQAVRAAMLARQSSRPVSLWEEQVSFSITRNSSGVLSLFWDRRSSQGGPALTERHGDTWLLTDGCPLLLRDIPLSVPRRELPEEAVRQAARREREGISCYAPDYPELLRLQFRPDRFYLTEDQLCFFYPMRSVASRAEGIPVFSVPLSAAAEDALSPADGKRMPKFQKGACAAARE